VTTSPAEAASEAAFLDEINARLPPGVDWKQGAITYLREIVNDGGEATARYHLVKPFVGGPDFTPFWQDAFQFLDLIEALDLPQRARLIDVGCGPGWTVHWLCKLGHRVVGCDISAELLEVAEERMSSDPHPPYAGEPFDYELRVHDVEAAPLGLAEPADAAVFEATLHHFYNPVAVLKNIAEDLTPDAVIGVIEGAAPPVGSEWDAANLDLMNRYHTIERPYTRPQLLEMLALAGFDHVEFFRPINGLFRQTPESGRRLGEDVMAENINILIASRTAAGLARVLAKQPGGPSGASALSFLEGFHNEEQRPDGSRFRWVEPRARLSIPAGDGATLRFTTQDLGRRRQKVVAIGDGKVIGEVVLKGRRPAASLQVPAGVRAVELHSDRAFSPLWGGGHDGRLLSYMVDVD
jgi:SAM-dependent methyltransferase